MKPIIEVNGLWKEYQRGAQKEQYLSLRDQLFKGLKPKKRKEAFWALEDINFKVEQGDSLAIIGKNGAGKSTLLKILSKITPPTKGEIVLRGRLASLLEVGTGFHPELTGRENVYLNGSILGLGRKEINRQFDAIVDFSGVEAFLDTPLKHYSSGMQLRLAFAVAAHLEPEILVIDEVLAVGDSTFQKKCIDKMTEVSRNGRTILFVSHNMEAVRNLCKTGVLLQNGIITQSGLIETTIDAYLNESHSKQTTKELDCENLDRQVSTNNLTFDTISSNDWTHAPKDSLSFKIKLKSKKSGPYNDLLFGVNIRNRMDQCIYHLSNVFLHANVDLHQDENSYTFILKNSQLKPGLYTIGFFIRANEEIQDWIPNAAQLEVTEGNLYSFNNSDMIQGMVQPNYDFYVE